MKTLDFVEWFDPDNIEHLHAYHILQETGCWPEGFVPETAYLKAGWNIVLMCILADKWIDYKLKEKEDG